MAFVRIGFNVHGDQQVDRAFELSAHMAEDMSEPLDEMADVILTSVREQFDSEGAAGGTPWLPLSEPYGTWKASHYPGRPILVRDGGMKGAALNKTTAVTVTRDRMVYEPRNSYLIYHQEGRVWVQRSKDGPSIHELPQRKVVALSEAQKREAVDRVFSNWIHRSMVEARRAAGGTPRL